MQGKTLVKNTESKTNQYISRLDSVGHRRAYLDSRADDPYVVCFFGSAGTIRQLYEILRDFVPPDNIAWVVACARDEISALDVSALGKQVRASRRSDSVVLIEKGTVTSLVEKKVYVVHRHCRVFVSKGTLEVPQIMGMALGKSKKEEAETPWLRHTVQILRGGSRHGIKFVFLSSLEANGIGAQLVRRLHDAGHKFFTPLFTPFERPGGQPSQEHIGGLTKHLMDGPIPYKSAALNELVAAITESIGEED